MEDRIELRQFDFSNVEGISMNQLQQHFQLYKGYVGKVNEIWNLLSNMDKSTSPSTTISDIRSLKLGESYALDGVKLHVLYFENIGGSNKIPYGLALDLIERDFGSFSRFLQRLKDVALSMRGWAIAAIEPLDGKLHIYGLDEHDKGAVWGAVPILVLDVYEHAYMIDFGIDRKAYIETFIKNINWSVVNSRIKAFGDLRAVKNNSLEKNAVFQRDSLSNNTDSDLYKQIMHKDIIDCSYRCPYWRKEIY